MKHLNALQPLALLLLRFGFGIIFMTHGYQILTHKGALPQGVFQQHGFPGYFASIEGVVELFGGGLLLLGLFTRGAALVLALEHVFLVWKLYTPSSYLIVSQYAYMMVVITGFFVLATFGAGVASLDHPLFESGGGRSRPPRNAKPGK
jgi:putative oxidoreductase